MLGVAGALAVLRASMRVQGVMAFGVIERTHEIGVRMALGANPLDTLRLFLRRGMVLATTGISIGLPCALSLARLAAYVLYGCAPMTCSFISLRWLRSLGSRCWPATFRQDGRWASILWSRYVMNKGSK